MTHYSRTLTSEAHYDDRSCARPLFRPAFWFRIAVADPGGGGGDRDDHPPPLNFPDTENAMSKGGGVLVNVQVQEWGCFSIFRRADDVTRTMSKGGGVLVNVFTPPPPLQEILYPRLDLDRDPPPPKKSFTQFRPLGVITPVTPPPPGSATAS